MPAQLLRKAVKHAYLYVRKSVMSSLPKEIFDGDLPVPIQSILVISQRRLGDIALEIPALRQLREACKTATLGIVAPGPCHALLRWACNPDVLFECPTTSFPVRALGAELRRRNWQVVIDLTTDYLLAPARLAKKAQAPIRIGFENAGREHYFNIVIPEVEAEHMAERFRRPMELLAVDLQKDVPLPELQDLPLNLPDRKPGDHFIGIHPGAAHQTQRWPAEYFAELCLMIHNAGGRCIVLGTKRELRLAEEVRRGSKGSAAVILIQGDVLQFAATLMCLDLLICNNSGPLHLAGLLGVPTLSFMGPTIKERWWPRGPRARVLRRDNLPCIGCNLGYCKIGTHACMREITPSDAFDAYSSCTNA